MSLDRALFNVATSRAKLNTIIICDENILNSVSNMSVEVRSFLESIDREGLLPIDNTTVIEPDSHHMSGIKVVGKIDLSQFETPKQKAVKSSLKRNVYIIDTNVFVNCPDIISKIEENYLVVLSAKVIDELDKLKIKLDTLGKQNVEKSLRNINRAMDKRTIKMELSDVELLPDDFNKKSPDNNILTVALKYKNDNPILLTSDNGLQVKAKGLGISTISLKDFLKR
jgi:rRNA-processing protein FCF1